MSKFISPSASNLVALTMKDRKEQQDEEFNQSSSNNFNQPGQSNVGRFKKLRQYALAIARGEKLKNQNRIKGGKLTYWESVSQENMKIKEDLIRSGIIDPDSEESDTSMVVKDQHHALDGPKNAPQSAPPMMTGFNMKSKSGSGSNGSAQYESDELLPSYALKSSLPQSAHPASTGFNIQHRTGDGSTASARDNATLPHVVVSDLAHSAPPFITSFSMKYRPEAGSNGSVQYSGDTLVPSRVVRSNFLLSRTPKWPHDSIGVAQNQKGQETTTSVSLQASDRQNTSNKPLIAITNAFRDSYYSTVTTVSTESAEAADNAGTGMEGGFRKQIPLSTPPRSSHSLPLGKAEASLLLSPKFLFPRPAPKPPTTSRSDLHSRAFHPPPYSAPPDVTTFHARSDIGPDRHKHRDDLALQCNSRSLYPHKEQILDSNIETFTTNRPTLSIKINNHVPEVISTPASSDSLHRLGGLESPGSVGSGLARIGAALLSSAQSMEEIDSSRLSTTSHFGIGASASEDSNASITPILAALEDLGLKALEIFAKQERRSDISRLPTTTSAPASLSNYESYANLSDSKDERDSEDQHSFVEQDSCKATIGSWNSWNASLHETFSNLEQILQAQGIDVHRPEKITELWQALAFSPSSKSFSSRKSIKSIRSLKSYNSHLSDKSHNDQKNRKFSVKDSNTKDKSARLSMCSCPEPIPEATSLPTDLDSVGRAI